MSRGRFCQVTGFLRKEEVDSGVKQRCVLSPLMFLLVIDWVMRKMNTGTRGQWTLTERREDIDFANDMAHVTRESFRLFVKYAEQMRLH